MPPARLASSQSIHISFRPERVMRCVRTIKAIAFVARIEVSVESKPRKI